MSESTAKMSRFAMRFSIFVLVPVFLLVGAAVIALRVYVTRIERRGADLQSRVLALTPGVSTLEEVRQMAEQTQLPISYYGGPKPCDETDCEVGLAIFTSWLSSNYQLV